MSHIHGPGVSEIPDLSHSDGPIDQKVIKKALFENVNGWKLRKGDVIALGPETTFSQKGQDFTLKVEDCYHVKDVRSRPLTTPAGNDNDPFIISA